MRNAGGSVAVLGGARGTNEDAFMWARLADAVGSTMRDAQLDDGLPASILGFPQATIDSTCNSRTVVLLAPDVKEELPVLYVRLRDAVTKHGVKVIEIATHDTGFTKYAWRSVKCEPGMQADAVRNVLADATVAAQIASGDVTVVAGRANLAESASFTMAAVEAVIASVPAAKVLPALRRGNVRGALSVGLAPTDGRDAAAILEAAATGNVECLVLLGADPLSDVADADLARRGLAGARFVLSVDTFMSASSAHADVVLPAAAYGEKEGTTTNLEGRVTNVVQKITPRGTSRADWMIAAELLFMLGHDSGVANITEVQKLMSRSVPSFGAVATSVDVRKNGIVVSAPQARATFTAPVAAPRSSYDFRLVLSRKLYDRAAGTANSPSMSQLAPGASVHVNPLDLERIGAAEGSNVRVSNQNSSIVLPVVASVAVPRGTALVPFNQPGADARELVRHGDAVTDVRIENI